jgi:hypothetical protein
MTALDPRLADRLAKLLGMLGSDHAGERAAAGLKASELLKANRLTWRDVVAIAAGGADKSVSTEQEDDIADKIRFAVERIDLLNSWERGFITSIQGRTYLSDKQERKLDEILDKLGGGR